MRILESAFKKCNLILITRITSLCFIMITPIVTASAQSVLFDFDNAPLHSSLPIDQTAGGITAHLSGTGQGYSIQEANVLGFTPPGFAGRIIDPNSINLADLIIRFDQTLTDFSIMYCCQELGCDDAATMRVTAYRNGNFVGTNTKTASFPGTWPVDTLSCSFPQGFDSVVVHYASPPPTCRDYGVIFLADNMRVTPRPPTGVSNPKQTFSVGFISPNPITQSATISFSLVQSENIHLTIYDATGRLIKNLFDGHLIPGEHQINWDASRDAVDSGVYFLRLTGENFSRTYKLVVLK